MGHLSKLQDELGPKGLTVLAITGEDRATHLRYRVHEDPGFTFPVAVGSAPDYEIPGLPYAFLIDPEGRIVYRGSPGGLSRKKVLLPALSGVREPTPEEVAARSQQMLARAEALAADRLFLRAEQAFEALLAAHPRSEAAAVAKRRLGEMLGDEGARAELAAQKDLARIVGGAEAPDPAGKRPKPKQIAAAAKRLAELAEDLRETAPRAAALAAEWHEIFATPWE